MNTPAKSLLAIRRPLLQSDHAKLRENMLPINHAMPHLQIKWRRLGEAGISLVDRGDYQRLLEAKNGQGKLVKVGAQRVAQTLNETIIPCLPTEKSRINPVILRAAFMGNAQFVSIAYLLEDEPLIAEQNRFSTVFDKMNGINTRWNAFVPHISVATIDKLNSTGRQGEDILAAFSAIKPEQLTFYPAVAVSDKPAKR